MLDWSRVRISSRLRRLLFVLGGALVSLSTVNADAASKARSTRAATESDEGRVNVTYTGFRVLGDGRSLVYVELTGKVGVNVEQQGKQVKYRLEGARVALRNNRNPLLTFGFVSALDSARWVAPPAKGKKAGKRAAKADAGAQSVELVLSLRADVTPSHVLRESPTGAVLEITLPALRGK